MKLLNKTYTSEIQSMLFGFGDSRRPLEETAFMVEEVVHDQMTAVLNQALDVAAAQRRNNNNLIIAEDILFLMRKSPVKVQRLVKYLDVRDMMNSSASTEESTINSVTDSKRVKRCRNFFEKIDTDGQLIAAVENRLYDQVRMTRLERQDAMSQNLDERKYAEYSKARQASFRGNKLPNKFYDWVTQSASGNNEFEDVKIDKVGLEILTYLAYETIGQLVDLCLAIRMERVPTPSGGYDPISRQMDPIAVNPHFPMVQDSSLHGIDSTVQPSVGSIGGAKADKLINTGAIEPWEIREVIRRYHQRPGPLSFYHRRESRSKPCPIFVF